MRSLLLALLLMSAAVAITSCESLIDLGPKAELSDGSPADDNECGLEPSGSVDCNACIISRCCAESKACYADSNCNAQRSAARLCIYERDCVEAILGQAGPDSLIVAFIDCTLDCAAKCIPTGDCLTLAECCRVGSPIVKKGCLATVEAGDQQACRENYKVPYQCDELLGTDN